MTHIPSPNFRVSRPDRAAFLAALIGRPYLDDARGPEAYDCWFFAEHVMQMLTGCGLPDIARDLTNHAAVRAAIAMHPERAAWVEYPMASGRVVTAPDCALVVLAPVRSKTPALDHVGVWLRPECRVIHAERASRGVVFDDMQTLRIKGYGHSIFLVRR